MPPFADVLQWEHLPFPKSLRDFQRLFPDTGYDLSNMRDIIICHPWKVLWEMEKDATAKFGYRFKCLAGIPA
jgi:hypothetical protein